MRVSLDQPANPDRLVGLDLASLNQQRLCTAVRDPKGLRQRRIWNVATDHGMRSGADEVPSTRHEAMRGGRGANTYTFM